MAARTSAKSAAISTGVDLETAAILRRRAELLAEPLAEAGTEPGTLVLTFSRGARLAVNAEHVREVGPIRKIEPLPRQPAFVAGLVAWRGRPILAIEPSALLGVGATGAPTHQIVLGTSRGEVALLADEVRGVVGIRPDDLGPAPAGPIGLDRFASGYDESIGLLIDAGLLEDILIDHSVQPKEVRS